MTLFAFGRGLRMFFSGPISGQNPTLWRPEHLARRRNARWTSTRIGWRRRACLELAPAPRHVGELACGHEETRGLP